MSSNPAEILSQISKAQKSHDFSIIKLSEPVAGGQKSETGQRTSDVSTEGFLNPTPAILEAELATYKELFAKYRFSYLEQVTKEKFIRAIVGDPPQVVEHTDIDELEAKLAIAKAELKLQKTQVAELVTELERRGRALARKYEKVREQKIQLGELPKQIEELEASLETLRLEQRVGSNPTLNMSLEKTLELVEKREREASELDRQIEQLQVLLPRKTRELERLDAELTPLEAKRIGSMSAAKEARRRKEEALGGAGDDLEERGRWWRGVDSGLRGMLDVEN